MKRFWILGVCTALCFGIGCDDRTDGGTDSGGITLPDSGPPVETDSGPPVDECPPATSPIPPMGMICEADTLTCLMSASTAEAQEACLEADANTAPCRSCLLGEQLHTCTRADGGGCDGEWGEVECCIADECGSSPTDACADMAIGNETNPGPCAPVFQAAVMCINSAIMGMRCGISNFCFMPAGGGFLPDFEPRRFSFDPSLFEAHLWSSPIRR